MIFATRPSISKCRCAGLALDWHSIGEELVHANARVASKSGSEYGHASMRLFSLICRSGRKSVDFRIGMEENAQTND